MKRNFNDDIVRITQEAVRDNRLKHIKEVRMIRKRRWNCFKEIFVSVIGAIALLALFSWFDIGWTARVIGIIAVAAVTLIALGEDDE